ncbi:hypothetical protein HDU83_008051 [Entophlyctis luteolus]|nr:hypothetical protein HDU83_008051 [Entophlyctis luteolus]
MDLPAYSLFADSPDLNAGAAAAAADPPATATVLVRTTHAVVERKDTVLVSLQPVSPAGQPRAPVSIVCVVDLSSSMDSPAAIASTAGGPKEADGLSLLDIVKHAVKTIIASLGPADSLAVVSFSDMATVEFEMCRMDATNSRKALDTVSNLRSSGVTNLWAGIDTALNVIHESGAVDAREHSTTNAVFVFTDGLPNVRPPGGELDMLKKRKMKKFGGQLPCTLHTFGFGNSLDSTLLNSLAVFGNGGYSFIPDAGFVGTVFVDSACNLFATVVKDVTVKVEALNGAQVQLYKEGTVSMGNHPVGSIASAAHPVDGGPFEIHFGGIQDSQSKDIVFSVARVPSNQRVAYLQVEVTYQHVGLNCTAGPVTITKLVDVRSGGDEPMDKVFAQWIRLSSVDMIVDAHSAAMSGNFEDAQKRVKDFIEIGKKAWSKVSSSSGDEKRRLKELLVDLEGQISEAFKEEFFHKWGKHYLLSILNAHRLQQCNNFKDPGVQVYQSDVFEDLREKLTEIFLNIPPPTPSLTSSSSNSRLDRRSTGSPAPAHHPRPVDLRRYFDSSGACFAGQCLIVLADGTTKAVQSIVKGDLVRTGHVDYSGHAAPVKCLLKTRRERLGPLVHFSSGLLITPFHPIKRDGRWMFPSHALDAEEYRPEIHGDVDVVYSIVLGRVNCRAESGCSMCNNSESRWYGSTVVINGVECAALGHGQQKATDEKAIGHEYFGRRELVLADLMQGKGYRDGVHNLHCVGVMSSTDGAGASAVHTQRRDQQHQQQRHNILRSSLYAHAQMSGGGHHTSPHVCFVQLGSASPHSQLGLGVGSGTVSLGVTKPVVSDGRAVFLMSIPQRYAILSSPTNIAGNVNNSNSSTTGDQIESRIDLAVVRFMNVTGASDIIGLAAKLLLLASFGSHSRFEPFLDAIGLLSLLDDVATGSASTPTNRKRVSSEMSSSYGGNCENDSHEMPRCMSDASVVSADSHSTILSPPSNPHPHPQAIPGPSSLSNLAPPCSPIFYSPQELAELVGTSLNPIISHSFSCFFNDLLPALKTLSHAVFAALNLDQALPPPARAYATSRPQIQRIDPLLVTNFAAFRIAVGVVLSRAIRVVPIGRTTSNDTLLSGTSSNWIVYGGVIGNWPSVLAGGVKRKLSSPHGGGGFEAEGPRAHGYCGLLGLEEVFGRTSLTVESDNQDDDEDSTELRGAWTYRSNFAAAGFICLSPFIDALDRRSRPRESETEHFHKRGNPISNVADIRVDYVPSQLYLVPSDGDTMNAIPIAGDFDIDLNSLPAGYRIFETPPIFNLQAFNTIFPNQRWSIENGGLSNHHLLISNGSVEDNNPFDILDFPIDIVEDAVVYHLEHFGPAVRPLFSIETFSATFLHMDEDELSIRYRTASERARAKIGKGKYPAKYDVSTFENARRVLRAIGIYPSEGGVLRCKADSFYQDDLYNTIVQVLLMPESQLAEYVLEPCLLEFSSIQNLPDTPQAKQNSGSLSSLPTFAKTDDANASNGNTRANILPTSKGRARGRLVPRSSGALDAFLAVSVGVLRRRLKMYPTTCQEDSALLTRIGESYRAWVAEKEAVMQGMSRMATAASKPATAGACKVPAASIAPTPNHAPSEPHSQAESSPPKKSANRMSQASQPETCVLSPPIGSPGESTRDERKRRKSEISVVMSPGVDTNSEVSSLNSNSGARRRGDSRGELKGVLSDETLVAVSRNMNASETQGEDSSDPSDQESPSKKIQPRRLHSPERIVESPSRRRPQNVNMDLDSTGESSSQSTPPRILSAAPREWFTQNRINAIRFRQQEKRYIIQSIKMLENVLEKRYAAFVFDGDLKTRQTEVRGEGIVHGLNGMRPAAMEDAQEGEEDFFYSDSDAADIGSEFTEEEEYEFGHS